MRPNTPASTPVLLLVALSLGCRSVLGIDDSPEGYAIDAMGPPPDAIGQEGDRDARVDGPLPDGSDDATSRREAGTPIAHDSASDPGVEASRPVPDTGLAFDASADSDGSLDAGGVYDVSVVDVAADARPQERPPIASLSVGNLGACAVRTDGELRCWGHYIVVGSRFGSDGRAGPIYLQSASSTPAGKMREASIRHSTCLSVADNGEAWGFGYNSEYQVGDWTRNPSPSSADGYARPLRLDASGAVPSVSTAVSGAQASSGHNVGCLVAVDTSVLCWGSSVNAILPSRVEGSTSANHYMPLPVASIDPPEASTESRLLGATRVSVGKNHACALLADGTVACWGETGLLGVWGPRPARPVLAEGLTAVVKVEAGASSSCALKADGTVLCWGRNNYGQIGAGAVGGDASTPTEVMVDEGGTTRPLSRVRDIAVGDSHACAVTVDGDALCWGSNLWGKLGVGNDGSQTNTKTYPVATRVVLSTSGGRNTLLTNARAIAAGDSATCAVMNDERILCWGSGPLGTNATERSFLPVEVEGLE